MASTCVIAFADAFVFTGPIGVLYIIPIMLAAAVLSPLWTVLFSVCAAVLSQAFYSPVWTNDAIAHGLTRFLVYAGAGLFVCQIVQTRQLTLEYLAQLKREAALREEAEDESRQLVEQSPGAIITVDSQGRIQRANEAARKLLGLGAGPVSAYSAAEHLPILASFLDSSRSMPPLRTIVEGSGRRVSGESFYAQMWLSSIDRPSGRYLVVIFSDATEALRDREELGLRQLLMSSRMIAAAVSHEVRNLSAAAHNLYRDLGDLPGIAERKEYQALARLIDSLRRVTTEHLAPAVEEAKAGADLNSVLEELYLILQPVFRDSSAKLSWSVARDLPRVRGDHSGLLQVFLNLAQNSHRVLENVPNGELAVVAYSSGNSAVVRLTNNGPPIQFSQRLFEPLQPQATGTGLGLFISRAILRTYGGELHCIPLPEGTAFLTEMPALLPVETPTHA